MNAYPPKWADRFLEWYCDPYLLEDLQGDLYEIFQQKNKESGIGAARRLYIWLVLRSFRFSALKKVRYKRVNSIGMIRNNLKIATRVMWRDKFNSSINLIGLAVGVACFLLMGFYVQRELSFDQFHSKKDRIYRVWVKEVYAEDKIFFNSITPLVFEKALEENFGELERVVRFDKLSLLVGEGEDRENESVAIISPDFFEVFDFQIIDGNERDPLPTRNDILVSESYSKKYFGELNPMGRKVLVQIGEESREFTVSCVIRDIRQTSGIQFDMAFSDDNSIDVYGERAMNAWFNVATETYALIQEESDISSVEQGIPDMVEANLGDEVQPGEYNIGFQPLTDIHLNREIPPAIAPVGNPEYVTTLGIISILVLIIACINYTTLSIGQSLKRSREVGVRKAMGALKGTLVNQYLTESILIALLSVSIGVGLAYLALPVFNDLTDADISLKFQSWHLLLYGGLVFIIGFSSGIYPALILSGKQAVNVLKGIAGGAGGHAIRKVMVIVQFVIAVFLISSTLIMRQQLNYMQSKDLGYDYQATVSVPLYPDPSSRRLTEFINSAMVKGDVLREKLSLYPEIADIGMGSHVFGSQGWGTLAFTDDQDNFRRFRLLVVDPYYFNTFDLEVNQGRAFDSQSEADKRNALIINQAAVDYFGLDDPVGNRLPKKDFLEHQIIGVTDNFNYASLHDEVEPLVITQDPGILFPGISDYGFDDSPVPKLVFKFTGDQLLRVRDILEKEWDSTFPDEDLEFSFVEEDIRFQYANEERLNRLIVFATILAIVIAGLGLLGLTVLVVNSRIKEIGIRKVIGASSISIFGLLARSFAVQLAVGIGLSVPLTYVYMKDWLMNFSFQTNIGVGAFLISALIATLVSLIVISYHTIKASLINPVRSLRSE